MTIVHESGDELQRSVFHLNNICKSYNLKILINKTKTMAFKGKYTAWPTGRQKPIDNKQNTNEHQINTYTNWQR
jgi:hypothetical protein